MTFVVLPRTSCVFNGLTLQELHALTAALESANITARENKPGLWENLQCSQITQYSRVISVSHFSVFEICI